MIKRYSSNLGREVRVDILHVRVIPNAKKNEVKKFGDGFKVYLTAPPVEGKANKMLLKILAEEFDIKKSQLSIARGANSRDKVIRVTYAARRNY